MRLPPDIDENDFKFDVFVTYNRKDCTWVDTELLCLLRENQVKYCVDYEHFELGKVFVQAMVDSVYQSRKVLAVWSENYASSKYCKQELDYAIQRSFQNNDCSVIVLRLDRTGRKRLPKPLRAKTFLGQRGKERMGKTAHNAFKRVASQEQCNSNYCLTRANCSENLMREKVKLPVQVLPTSERI